VVVDEYFSCEGPAQLVEERVYRKGLGLERRKRLKNSSDLATCYEAHRAS
jgi:hypothetical protein